MPAVGKDVNKSSRRNFLKLGVAGIPGAALLFLPGCLDEDDDDDNFRRRRRRGRRR